MTARQLAASCAVLAGPSTVLQGAVDRIRDAFVFGVVDEWDHRVHVVVTDWATMSTPDVHDRDGDEYDDGDGQHDGALRHAAVQLEGTPSLVVVTVAPGVEWFGMQPWERRLRRGRFSELLGRRLDAGRPTVVVVPTDGTVALDGLVTHDLAAAIRRLPPLVVAAECAVSEIFGRVS